MKSLNLPTNELQSSLTTTIEAETDRAWWISLTGIKSKLEVYWPLLAITLAALISHLETAPNFIETREGIFYVRGVERYSVAELRPYWPGYPVYMWAGKLFNLIISNPAQALHILAVVSSTLCLWPIFNLTSEWRTALGGTPDQSRWAGWAAGALWAIVPLSWLNGSEIFGDPLALLMGLVMLWLCWRSLRSTRPTGWLLAAAVVSGLMLGVRLAYVPLLVVLAYAIWRNRRHPLMWRNRNLYILPLLVAAALALSIGLWLGWQLALEGWKFIQAGESQLAGHYSEWGNSIVSDHNVLTRPLRLLETYLVYGLGGWWPGAPWFRLPATGLMLGLAVTGGWRLARHEAGKLALLWAGSYVVCTLLNYDVDLARYSFPLVAITCIAAGIGLPHRPHLAILSLSGAFLAVVLVTMPLALEHHTSPLLPPRVTSYIKAKLDPAKTTVLITDDMTPLIFFMEENAPQYQFVRAKQEEVAVRVKELQSSAAGQNTIYAAWLPGNAPAGWQPQARLCRNQYLDARGPLEIWLYRYAPDSAAPQQPLECY